MIGPPIASSSGRRPADTSFCMELRIDAGEDPLFVLIARCTYKSERCKEGELAPQHGFFIRLKLTRKTRMPKPGGDALQSLLSYHGKRQADKWRTLNDPTRSKAFGFDQDRRRHDA